MNRSIQTMVQSTVATPAGLVTAMHPRAAEAGAARLAKGGNAVDAFIEAALTIGVVEPFMSGLGGHGSALVRLPDGRIEAVDFLSRAPELACQPGAAIEPIGPRSVPVPTTATGFGSLHALHGKTQRSELAEAAVSAAREGVPVEGYTAGMILRSAIDLRKDPGGREVFLRFGGFPPRPSMSDSNTGDVLTLPNYGRTIAEWGSVGGELLRSGWVADTLTTWMVENGGFVRSSDLSRVPAPSASTPHRTTFDGYELHGAPGSSGFPFVAECLGIWSQFDDEPELGSAAYYHRLIEVFRVAFEDRLRWLGDPEGGRSPLDTFFNDHLWRLRAREILAEKRAESVLARDLRRPGMPALHGRSKGDGPDDDGCTTHVNVVDASGMAVSGTFTLGHPFGATVVIPKSGMLLLNTLYQFSREPGHPNEIRPGLRPTWNGSPIIVTKGNELVATLGAPGATRIPTALVQVLLGVIRYGLSAQQAIDHPRVHAEHDAVDLEWRVPEAVVTELIRLGHRPRLVREGPASSNFARPTCVWRGADGMLESGLDAWRLAAAVASE